MNILELSAYYYPEQFASSYLWENLAESFVNEGFCHIVCCPTPCRGISSVVRSDYKKRKYEILYDGNLHVMRFPLFKEGKNPLLRAVRYIIMDCYMFFWSISSRKASNCQVIFVGSTPPIQGAMAALVKKIKKKPLVYNLQDIFPDSLVGAGLINKGGFLWKIGRKIEDFSYRNADRIIVISEDCKNNIMAKGVPEDKIEVIYNWVDEKAVTSIPRCENKLFERYNLDRSKFYVTYCGNIGLSQNLQMLADVAKELEETKDIQFVLVGEGAYLEKLKETIKQRQIKNITLLPFQPYADISHVFSFGDVGLVISKPGIGSASVPSKTWSIMSASRPVLANFDENELKIIIADNNCGIFTKAGDKKAFTDAVLKLYNDRDLCMEMGKNGRQFVMDNLTKAVGTQKYIDVIKSLEKN